MRKIWLGQHGEENRLRTHVLPPGYPSDQEDYGRENDLDHSPLTLVLGAETCCPPRIHPQEPVAIPTHHAQASKEQQEFGIAGKESCGLRHFQRIIFSLTSRRKKDEEPLSASLDCRGLGALGQPISIGVAASDFLLASTVATRSRTS